MTVKQQERNAISHILQYNRSNAYSLDDVYKSHSSAKARAWRYCLNLCEEKHGRGLKVISHNVDIFTAGFVFTDPIDGDERFMFITPHYDCEVPYVW